MIHKDKKKRLWKKQQKKIDPTRGLKVKLIVNSKKISIAPEKKKFKWTTFVIYALVTK